MPRRVIVALGLLLAVSPVAHAVVRESDKFQHEAWSGAALSDDGKFLQCVMWSSAINNWDLGLSLLPSGELRLGLRNQKIDMFWNMVFNQLTGLRPRGRAGQNCNGERRGGHRKLEQ